MKDDEDVLWLRFQELATELAEERRAWIAFDSFPLLRQMREICQGYPFESPEQRTIVRTMHLQVAEAYRTEGHYPRAIEHYELAIALFDAGVDEDDESFEECCLNQLDLYQRMGETAKAEQLRRDTAFRGIVLPQKREPRLKRDPIEYTKGYIALLEELSSELAKRLAGVERKRGSSHRYWAEKAALLKDHYGIEWKSPAVLNPRVRFD